MYARSQRKAAAASVTLNDGTRNVWDLFEGAWPCAAAERFGKVGDGGKWLCDPEGIKAAAAAALACVVYSFGSNGEPSFEMEVSARLGCEVHVFDPTLDAATTKRMAATLATTTGVFFHPWGLEAGSHGGAHDSGDHGSGGSAAQALRLARRDFHHPAAAAGAGGSASASGGVAIAAGSYVSLRAAMAALGHGFVDVLKVDIEGAEWAVLNDDLLCFPDATESSAPEGASAEPPPHEPWPPPRSLPFGQLSVELHHPGGEAGEAGLLRLMRGLHAWGLRPFRREPNVANVQRCWEYSFVPKAGHRTRSALQGSQGLGMVRGDGDVLAAYLADCALPAEDQHRRAAAWLHGL
jgi:hypothetical protein